ncbi:hypothetical protein JRO89_XS10G0012900 [Xanthoceras sorbifolium]|uniref:RING-type E3 ubiquitin transferase n=1 Tax=Xanthoceras sorbifolium TaxID=99658 RepID=A0ABQ8HH93_9ROSI|nr:hypothetical protein JRO89_XS10G0012900 [Xanthoceras sorbifolium]
MAKFISTTIKVCSWKTCKDKEAGSNLSRGTMEPGANAPNLGTDQQNLGSSSDASVDNGALLTGDGHDQVTVNEAPIVQEEGANSTFEVAAPEEDASGQLLSIGDYTTTTTLADPQAGNSSEQQRAVRTAENSGPNDDSRMGQYQEVTYADGSVVLINRSLLDNVARNALLEGAPPPGMYLPSEMPPPVHSTDQVPAEQTAEGQGVGDHPHPQPHPPVMVRDITPDEYREILLQQIHNIMVLMQRAERTRFMELIALEEEIETVTTGLTPDSVLPLLRQRKYQPAVVEGDTPDNSGFCSICQDEFAAGEDIGTLDCGHDHHANCISEWLVVNNSCPICKEIGLAALPGQFHRR